MTPHPPLLFSFYPFGEKGRMRGMGKGI